MRLRSTGCRVAEGVGVVGVGEVEQPPPHEGVWRVAEQGHDRVRHVDDPRFRSRRR